MKSGKQQLSSKNNLYLKLIESNGNKARAGGKTPHSKANQENTPVKKGVMFSPVA